MFDAFECPIRSSRATVAFTAILLAVRLVWVPLHLAHEPHDDRYGHGRGAAHVEHADHESGHDHDGDHEPHPAAEHLDEPMAREVSRDLGFDVTPIGDAIAVTAPQSRHGCATQPDEEPPRPPPPRSGRARAPPAA